MRILSTSLGSSSFQLQRRTTSFSSLRFYAIATATESSSTPLKPKGRSTKHGKSYSSTLNLPRTSFDMRPKPEIREKLYRSRTTDELYRWQRENNTGEDFVLHDGPPYANGDLHMGHALNKILKDIINRYNVLQGRKVHYLPGWDCHGLPIESKAISIFKDRDLKPHEIPPLELRSVARQEAEKSIQTQKKQFQEFGIMVDWSQEGTYRTFDPSYEMRQLKIFGEMARRGLIYRAYKPVYWSPSSRTALAEAELEYSENHTSKSVYVKFELDHVGDELRTELAGKVLEFEEKKIELVIWTTTPWTLPSNMAIAVNPELTYSLIRIKKDDSLIVVASERVQAISELKIGLIGPKGNDEREVLREIEEIAKFQGTSLLSSTYRHLFLNDSSSSRPILPADYVTGDSGTGLVHSAPSHGLEDYEMFQSQFSKKEDLISPVDDDGRYTQEILKLGDATSLGLENLVGKEVLGEGGKLVSQMMDRHGKLLSEIKIRHKYPYDWRSKLPVIVRATSQWFANLDQIKSSALKSLEKVKFTPPSSRSRLESFVKGRSEWCISRQRVWGVPIPVIYNLQTDEALITPENILHIISILEVKGSDYWWIGDAEEFVSPIYKSQDDGQKKWKKGNDTIDVWFDSGTSWSMLKEQRTKNGELKERSNVYFEGNDQHRGWFQSSLLTAISTNSFESADQPSSSQALAPFENLLTHGFVVDKKGKKMSKSIGNVIDPLSIIKGDGKTSIAYGADVLRLWAAKTDYTTEIPIGDVIIKNTSDSYRKLRNTARFMLGNLSKPEEVPNLDGQNLSLPDLYLLHELHELDKTCSQAYSVFDFAQVTRRLNDFASSTLSTLWFDMSKSTLYSDSLNSAERQACAAVLDQTLRTFTSILSPILPHLAEEIEHHRQGAEADPSPDPKGSTSVFQSGWQNVPSKWKNQALKSQVNQLLRIRDDILVSIEKARSQGGLKTAIEAGVDIYLGPRHFDSNSVTGIIEKHQESLAKLFIVSDVRVLNSNPPTSNNSQAWPSIVTQSHSGVILVVRPALLKECPRCWVYQSEKEGELCGRCHQAVKDVGVDV